MSEGFLLPQFAEEEAAAAHSPCIDDIPDELLSLIYGRLSSKSDRDAFSLTCRHWLHIDSAVRHHVQIYFASFHVPRTYQKLLLRLSQRFPSIFFLSLPGCTGDLDACLQVLQSGWSQLQHLSLYCCLNLDDTGLQHVGSGCGALRSLNLYRCKVSDKGLGFIASGCVHLEYLDLSYCQNVTDIGIDSLAKSCPKLSNVKISNSRHIEGWGFRNCSSLSILEAESTKVTDDGLCEGLLGCRALHWLQFGNIQGGITLGVKGFSCLGLLCKSLQVLCLRNCRVLVDSAVKVIAEGCPELKKLNMAVCPEVRFDGWNALAVFSQNLELLDVSRCRHFCDRSLFAVKLGCPSLAHLYLLGCPCISDVNVEDFLEGRDGVQILPFESFSDYSYLWSNPGIGTKYS